MKKRLFSRALALLMAVSLLSTTAFAASFADLQGAINDTGNSSGTQIDETGRYGYAWNTTDNTWGIEAWNDGTTRNVQLNDKVEYAPGDPASITIKGSDRNVTINMNGNTIDGKGESDTIFEVFNGATLTVNGDTNRESTITGGNAKDRAGAFDVSGGTLYLNDVTVTGNTAHYDAGAIQISNGNGRGSVTLRNVTITDNQSLGSGDGDGGAISMFNGDLTLHNSDIINNRAEGSGGGVWAGLTANIRIETGSRIIGNYGYVDEDGAGGTANDICYGDFFKSESEDDYPVINGIPASVNYQNNTWEQQQCRDDHDPLELVIYYALRTNDDANDDDTNNAGDTTIPDVTLPAESLPAGGATTGTTIEDEEVPLAGIFTRADAIGYLWEHTGSPEAELSDFPDVPEDHYWAVAIGWAQDMGIALPDEEGNFRPDDLVLLTSDEPEGELQEFLNRYAVFAGIELEDGELFIELEADADGIIMGEEAQVIFDEFFAKLEAALAKAA